MTKRIIDMLVAIIILPLVAIFFPIIALAIRIDSPGPVLFMQQRVGRYRKPFTLYKFRTMRVGVGDLPSHLAGEHEITNVGRWLRRTKIDEIPQFINVLVGQMSLVGPRPCLPSQAKLILARDTLGVFEVKPGITGLAQIEGLDMSNPEVLADKDAAYVKRISLMLDIKILLATLIGKGGRDPARPQS